MNEESIAAAVPAPWLSLDSLQQRPISGFSSLPAAVSPSPQYAATGSSSSKGTNRIISSLPAAVSPSPQYAAPGSSFSKDEEEGIKNTLEYQDNANQLTIFYSGMVYVYDNVPAYKVQALMLLARNQSSIDCTPSNLTMPSDSYIWPLPLHTELSFARKASLARFLKTRKGR